MYPVGSIYISVSISVDPAELYGGTWEVFGKGRTLVGVDAYGTDDDFKTSELTGGEKTHTITNKEYPTGNADNGLPASLGINNRGYVVGGSAGTGQVGVVTAKDVKAQPHNNMPPYITVYMWKRVA